MPENLCDKYKKREAIISEDYLFLEIHYDFGLNAIAFNKEKVIENEYDCCGGKISIKLSDNKEFDIEFRIKEPDLKFLYQIVLSVSYILGKTVHLQYYAKNFPYYPIEHTLNMDTFSPVRSSFLKMLMYKPNEILSTELKLLNDDSSYFHDLVPAILQTNASNFIEFPFTTEFGLLQKIARNSKKIPGKIYNDETDELKLLNEFCSEINQLLATKYARIKISPIEKKITLKRLNEKSSTKEQIKEFINSFENQRIKEYCRYVDEWNQIRSHETTIAHGGNGAFVNDPNKRRIVRELHNLLLDIIEMELIAELKIRMPEPQN